MERKFGYVLGCEDKAQLYSMRPLADVVKAFKDAFPEPAFNLESDPSELLKMEDQGSMGSCVGNSGTTVAEICYFLKTGRMVQLSRACGYYVSQQFDGLRGDVGATISGFQKTATRNGLCLEEFWPYSPRYNPAIPATAQGRFDFKLVASRPLQSFDDFKAAQQAGLPIHAGITWTEGCEQKVVENPTRGRVLGGHAIFFWLTHSGMNRMGNSWGNQFGNNGYNFWTDNAIKALFNSRDSEFVAYAPDGMLFPDLNPLG